MSDTTDVRPTVRRLFAQRVQVQAAVERLETWTVKGYRQVSKTLRSEAAWIRVWPSYRPR